MKNHKAENTAYASNPMIRISPIKLNQVADLIRGLTVEQALLQLTFSKKRVSNEVLAVLNSAIANAENNNNLDPDSLFVKEVQIGKSVTMKRFRARARGRGARILKPFSKIRVILEEKDL